MWVLSFPCLFLSFWFLQNMMLTRRPVNTRQPPSSSVHPSSAFPRASAAPRVKHEEEEEAKYRPDPRRREPSRTYSPSVKEEYKYNPTYANGAYTGGGGFVLLSLSHLSTDFAKRTCRRAVLRTLPLSESRGDTRAAVSHRDPVQNRHSFIADSQLTGNPPRRPRFAVDIRTSHKGITIHNIRSARNSVCRFTSRSWSLLTVAIAANRYSRPPESEFLPWCCIIIEHSDGSSTSAELSSTTQQNIQPCMLFCSISSMAQLT